MNIDDVKRIAVIGAGIMGAGVAEVCARAGYEVSLVDVSDKILKQSLEKIKDSLDRAVKYGKIRKEDADNALPRIKITTDLADGVRDAEVVIEAIPEKLDLKKSIFKRLDEICSINTIFASNTSSLMITDIATATERPEKVIGMHWFNPPQIMKLIEIIRGVSTSDETYTIIDAISKRLGKITIPTLDVPGFFTSRFIAAYIAEAVRCLELGIIEAKDIDTICKLAFNHPMGPLELADFIGIDTVLSCLDYIYRETGEPRYAPPLLLRKMVKGGYIGRKAGSRGGFYEYFRIPKEKKQSVNP